MDLIRQVAGEYYELRLWSDAEYEISTASIERLVDKVADRLEMSLQVEARWRHIRRIWGISFQWRDRTGLGWNSFEQEVDPLQFERRLDVVDSLAIEIAQALRRQIAPNDASQAWDIVCDRAAGLTTVMVQQEERAIVFYASQITFSIEEGRHEIEIRAVLQSREVSIDRNRNIEIHGMQLHAQLLEWLGIDDTCHIRFSPNCDRIETQIDNRVHIRFRTHPQQPRIASVERIGEMLSQGQIEIPRSGYFDRFLYPPGALRERAELRIEPRFIEPPNTSPEERRERLARIRDYIIQEQIVVERTELAGDAAQEMLASVTRPRVNAISVRGDTTCKYNAKSSYIRCAVNPCGPCENCKDYEKI